MKKYLAALLIGLMTLALVGEAQASFDSGHLFRVVYDTTGNVEVATDLGDISSWTSGSGIGSDLTLGGGSAAFSLSMFTGADWDDLRVAYFAVDESTNKNVWTSGPLEGTQTSGARQYTGIRSAISSLGGYYRTLDGSTGTVIAAQSAANSYWHTMDGEGIKTATFNAFLTTANGEISLAALAATGYVDQALYFYDTPDSIKNGVQVVTIRTMADGSTVINASAVPIPPSVFLLGSGILGLIGFRSRARTPLAG